MLSLHGSFLQTATITLICFPVISGCQPADHRSTTKYRRVSINWCRDVWYSLKKAVWKVVLWAPHRRRTASRGGGGFDLVIACREEWEMSPGGDERADLRRVWGVNPRAFFVRADDGAWVRGPTWGRIVLAASLVLLVDVNPYFKRIETFYRGETFRRETKLHHRKKCLGGEKKELYQRKTLLPVEKRQAFSRQGKKNFPPWKGVRGIIYHGQGFIMSWKGSWKDLY